MQLAQHLLVGHAVEIGEERDLDRGEALQVDVGPDPLEAAQQLRVVVERQIGVQAVDDVDFGERLVGALAQLVPGLLERHRVRAGVAGLAAARTSRTGSSRRRRWSPRAGCCSCSTCGRRAAFALAIGQPADRQQVGAVEQPDAVLEIEAHAGLELLGDQMSRPSRCNRWRTPAAAPSGRHKHSILLKTQQNEQRMLYSPQLTLSGAHAPALPGDHAKWVQIPRGAATVSGESPIPQPDTPAATVGTTHGRAECGKAWSEARIREPGYWRRAVLSVRRARLAGHRRVNTPKRSPVRGLSVRFVSVLVFALHVPPDHRPLPPDPSPDRRRSVRAGAAARLRRAGRRRRPDRRHDLHRPGRHVPARRGRAGRLPRAGVARRFQTGDRRLRPQRRLDVTLGVAPVAGSGRRVGDADEAPSASSAASVTVFDAAEIERRQIRRSPICCAARRARWSWPTAAAAAVTSLFVRGGESNYTKVLLDGIPLNEPGGTFNFSNVTTENLERVELVRGAQSALFGSDAMAGVIQLFTRAAPGEAAAARAASKAAPSARRACRPARRGKAGGFDYSVGAARSRPTTRVPNNEFDNTTLSGTAGVAAEHDATLRFVGRAELGNVGTPGQTAFGRPDLDAVLRAPRRRRRRHVHPGDHAVALRSARPTRSRSRIRRRPT